MTELKDDFGRRFEYLRLSITEVCNFRCTYCLPHGYRPSAAGAAPLSGAEVQQLVMGLAGLGVWKVRLTGGEPTVRRDLVELVERVAAVEGIRRVALSTNGHSLAALAAPLARAGLKQVNVSVDSLEPETFANITGGARLERVLDGVDAAFAAGLEVKVNAVRLRGWNDGELEAFAAWVHDRPVVVRFIELMRTGENGAFFADRHAPLGDLVERLEAMGFVRRPRAAGDGPAAEFRRPGDLGGLGLIAPTAAHFCESCNRLRVTSAGRLRLCLFGQGGVDLRPWLQPSFSPEAVGLAVRAALAAKPPAHRLAEGVTGDTMNLAAVGG